MTGIGSQEAFGDLRLPGQSKMARIMDGLASLCSELADNTYAWPAQSVTIPCVVVGYPTKIDFDLTFRRGGDTVELPVWFVAGPAGRLEVRNLLSDILSDAVSVKAVLDGNHDFGDVRVTDATIEEVNIVGVSYLSVKFDVEVLA
jgi:hypothetical protein